MHAGEMRVTLLSNSSRENFPGNTLTSFRVQLPETLDLSSGQWTCGLAEVQFFKSWFNLKNAYINLTKGGKVIKVLLDDGYYDGASLEERLNKNIGRYDTILEEEPHVHFEYDDITRRFGIQFTSGWYESIDIEAELSRCLGFTTEQREDLMKASTIQPLPPNTEPDRKLYTVVLGSNTATFVPVPTIMVYCDILQSSVVGDISAPLLRSIPVQGDHWTIQNSTFNSIQYCPIAQKNIRSIGIYLRSHLGEVIQFNSGLTIVTLDFRRVKSIHTY